MLPQAILSDKSHIRGYQCGRGGVVYVVKRVQSIRTINKVYAGMA